MERTSVVWCFRDPRVAQADRAERLRTSRFGLGLLLIAIFLFSRQRSCMVAGAVYEDV